MLSVPVGRWSDHGRLIEIVHRDGELVVVFPDVPDEFALMLHNHYADLLRQR